MNLKERKAMLVLGICLSFLIGSIPMYAVSPYSLETTQQARKVSGTVVDQSGESIIGANVLEKGTTNGVITDIDGNFTIEVSADATLEISFIGYITESVKVAGSQPIRVILKEDAQSLDEVVVVGYGVQKKKLVTGATVQVKGDNLQKLSTTSALSALQSQTPGVNITQSSGQPGEGFKVNIRGLGTTGKSAPLYVIDGVAGGDINRLNPSDIESIDVLKDAASAAIYGARAANGVILVATKQGKSGKIQLSYDGYYGVQNVFKMPELLDAQQYMTVMNTIEANDGAAVTDWSNILSAKNGYHIYDDIQKGWKGTNWMEEIRNANAPTQNHAISLIGGSEASKFSIGYAYTSQEGILGKPVQSTFDRSTARINSDHVLLKVKDYEAIKIGETLYYNYNTKSGIAIGNQYSNDISMALRVYPLMPVYGNDGGYFDLQDKKDSGIQNYQPESSNPLALMVYNRGNNISKNHSLDASAYVQIQPIKDLIFKSQFGYKFSSNTYRNFVPTYELSATDLKPSNTVTQKGGQGWSYTLENTLAYKFNVGLNHFDAVAGQSMEKWGMGENYEATNTNSLWNDFDHAWLTNTQGVTSSTSVGGAPWGEGALLSFFGRMNYDYHEKYMASLIVRADGSSNFARGHRWGYFPSASIGWVISEEAFMENIKGDWLDYFKVRASWGQNGNCDIPNFQYLTFVAFDKTAAYSFNNIKNGQDTGGYVKLLPNEDISWETSEQTNIGVDARFLNSRLGLALDWYQKSTKDWLVEAPILGSYGVKAPYINGGDVKNTGIEAALNWNDNVGKFTYGANLNFAYNKNEVTAIANSEGIIHGPTKVLSEGTTEMFRAQVGYPIGYFWGYKTAGVFQNQADINEWKANNPTLQENPQPGDLKFVNTNGDNKIDADDKTQIGNPNPKYVLGLSLNFGYKGFDVALTTNGAFGHQIARSYRKFADSYWNNFTTEVFDYWHGENTSNKYPRLTSGTNLNFQEISDIYIEDGDYMKIQNITLGYDFKKLFPNMPLGQARLYVTAQNLYTFTGYKGMDPEIGTSTEDDNYGWAKGIDVGFYPAPRTFLVGANLKF